jgi:hypothetical protein
MVKSLATKKEKVLIQMTLGSRAPRNKKEKDLHKQIKEIKAKGRVVEIPHN